MSNFEALALLTAWIVFDMYVIFVGARTSLLAFGMVETGLVDGIPVSIEFRRRLVWTYQITIYGGGTILQALGALVLIQIGMNVDGPKLQNLAYLFATIAAISAIAWPLGTATTMRYQLALLRKEEELSDA